METSDDHLPYSPPPPEEDYEGIQAESLERLEDAVPNVTAPGHDGVVEPFDEETAAAARERAPRNRGGIASHENVAPFHVLRPSQRKIWSQRVYFFMLRTPRTLY